MTYRGIFNVGTADPISFRDVADIVKQNAYCLIKEIPIPKESKWGSIKNSPRQTTQNYLRWLESMSGKRWKNM